MFSTWFILLCMYFILGIIPVAYAQYDALSPADVDNIGAKVFKNECASRDICLIDWNVREEFASLGIGHFIWYPTAQKGPFDESFPYLLEYIRNQGKSLPAWLDVQPIPLCPWESREDLLANRHSDQAQELYDFLKATKREQSEFLVKRLLDALPKLLLGREFPVQERISQQFYRIASTPQGIYVLIDYINFKGLGVKETERYNDQGWGLLHILTAMKGEEGGRAALEEFVMIAELALNERVNNSPIDRQEQKWLPGWKNRIKSYLVNSVD